ncbi:MAG: hypothetical protein ACYCWW_07780 [Deltaproteobacteria bacterium]
MIRKTSIILATFLGTACGPGADVGSFPQALANRNCHFAYHCCTPGDRNLIGLNQTSSQLDFANESECDDRLGASIANTLQADQESVQDKRMTYAQSQAQACLTALDQAASSCSFDAFEATTNDGGPCVLPGLFVGAVAGGGDCTQDADCAAVGAVCVFPAGDGGTVIVTDKGSCEAPPAPGQPCATTNGEAPCAQGACCNVATCVAYAAAGQPCQPGGCSAAPCDPASDFCGATSLKCTPLIANGQPCDPGDFIGYSCQSGVCLAGTCQAAGGTGTPQVSYQVCTGNPDGL